MAKDNIVIRFATLDDVDNVMKAINGHWLSNHILAHNKDFFIYYYSFGAKGNQINVIIGEDKDTGEIVGFLGFLKFGLGDHSDISTALWKALEGKGGFLGLRMWFFLNQNIKHIVNLGTSVNPKTSLPLLKGMKYHVEKLKHYYRISDKNEYKIAKITNKRILPIKEDNCVIQCLSNFEIFKTKIDDSLLNEVHPNKDKSYFKHRYYDHPVYQYKVCAIILKDTENVPAFFVSREEKCFETKVMRIVDYMGKESYFPCLAQPLQNMMDENNYEYIDCLFYGLTEKTMNDAGFILRKEDDPNIIPNYFQPFVRENVDVYFYTSKTDNFRVFKGDGDQDQPRLYDKSLC